MKFFYSNSVLILAHSTISFYCTTNSKTVTAFANCGWQNERLFNPRMELIRHQCTTLKYITTLAVLYFHLDMRRGYYFKWPKSLFIPCRFACVFGKTTHWFFPTSTMGVLSVFVTHLKLLFVFLSDVKYCCYKNCRKFRGWFQNAELLRSKTVSSGHAGDGRRCSLQLL